MTPRQLTDSLTGRVIVFASAKGGAGKTTLCASLAAELMAAGVRVVLVDADPQEAGGLQQWFASSAAGDPKSARAIASQLIRNATESAAVEARNAANQGAVVLVDTAGALTRTTAALLEKADLVVIPSRASGLDAARAVELAEVVTQSRVPCAVVLNATTRSAMPAHIRKELTSAGVKVLRTEVGQRVVFSAAQLHGCGPAEIPGGLTESAKKAAAEISELLQELRRLVR